MLVQRGKLLSTGKGFVVFTDPEGAPLKAVQGSGESSVDSKSVGAIVWDDYYVTMLVSSVNFPTHDGMEYFTARVSQQEQVFYLHQVKPQYGVREVNPRKVQNSLWLSYFRVDDVAFSTTGHSTW